MLGAGTVLDSRFVIQEIIGRGGMGAVYRAQDKVNGRVVAIKELLVHLENPYEKESAIKQFEREAKMLVRLSHPGIPEQLGYFLSGEGAYLAMEFIEGNTLESIVCENEELPAERTVIEWGIQLCDVLEYLHDLTPPIIFRDLKPSNVMLSGQQIKLIDFGIAKRLDPIMQTASALKGSGTPGYAPMEQYGKGSTDPRSDVYSLGATMYFLLTGRDPPQSVDIASGVDVLVPPRAYNPEISEAMEAAIMRMMALKKEDRYQTADDASKVLEECKKSIGLTVIRIPSRGKEQAAPTQQITQAVHLGTGGLKPSEPLAIDTAQNRALKMPQPPPVLPPPRRRIPWPAVAGLVVVLVAGCIWIGSVVARPVYVQVVVDSDQEADRVTKELSSEVTWTRSAATKVSEIQDGWSLQAVAGTPAQAQAWVKLLGTTTPAASVTLSNGRPGIRLEEIYPTQKEADAHEKNVAHRLHRAVEVVRHSHRGTATVVILETEVHGQARAAALKQKLEDHQVEARVTEH